MKLYLIRHGQTDWNKQGIIQGRTDIPLNEIGKQQARETSKQLESITFDCIYCSPLLRTKQTADIVNEGRNLPIYYDDRLLERNFGKYEGTKVKELDFSSFWNLSNQDQSHDEESAVSFFNRIHKFLDDIKRLEYGTILIVAHGGVSLPVYSYFHELKKEDDYLKYMLKNCEVAVYEI